MNIKAGDALRPFRLELVSPEAMKAWAVFLRDPNPIHLDPRAVQALGLGDRVINQGPANVAYVINMLEAAFPDSVIAELDLRYLGNVFGGDAVEATGKVTRVEEQARGRRVTCEVSLVADGRGPVIGGMAIVDMPHARMD